MAAAIRRVTAVRVKPFLLTTYWKSALRGVADVATGDVYHERDGKFQYSIICFCIY